MDEVDQATDLHLAGRFDEAASILTSRLDDVPDDAEALHLLGLGADANGEFGRAADLIGRAIASRETARFRSNYGMVLLHAGRPEEARATCARALQLRPNYPEALINLGASLEALGRVAEAANAFRRAGKLQPGRLEAWLNLGNALRLLGNTVSSEAAYRQAVSLSPALPLAQPSQICPIIPAQAWLNRSDALRHLNEFEEAEAACRQALIEMPGHGDALSSLGRLLGETGRLIDAEVLHRQALAMKPASAAAYRDLAITLSAQGRQHEALVILDLALALNPADAEVRQHRAFVLLLLGRLHEGWNEYEARFRTKQGLCDYRSFAHPPWTGELLIGRTLLLHAEQGLGDTIQFCRYIPALAAQIRNSGGRVVIEVQQPLGRLLRNLPGGAQIVLRGEALPLFDLHCPLLSLPRLLGTALDSIPPPAPLAPTQHAAARWRRRLPATGLQRVGLVWAGNPGHSNDRHRSVPFATLAPLWEVPNVIWHSLQVGPRRADLAAMPPGVMVEDLAPDLTDFDETAAALLRMHTVVTADTAVAHLAATLGVSVLLMLPHASDWRWLSHRTESPWYPSMRLFRQPAPLKWAPVAAEVAAALHDQGGFPDSIA